MHFDLEDDIAAIASTPGPSARGVIRLAGPGVLQSLADWAQVGAWPVLKRDSPFTLDAKIKIPNFAGRAVGIDVAARLIVWSTGKSFCGQPAIEIHTHGSPPLLSALLRLVCNHGCRLARPGEFTLRAFLTGKLDLPQAEAILGVIEADNRRGLSAALRQLAGGLSYRLHQLRDRLLNLLADMEAGLDFVDEDIEFISSAEISKTIQGARAELGELAMALAKNRVPGDRPLVVLIGHPNAGKSSLFNALADEKLSIISPTEGTTRDYLTHELDLDDIGCQLIDTAGIQVLPREEFDRHSSDECNPPSPPPRETDAWVEPMASLAAQQVSRELIEEAAIVVWCIDVTGKPPTEAELAWVRSLGCPTVVVFTKCDLRRPDSPSDTWNDPWADLITVKISSLTGQGLPELKGILKTQLSSQHTPNSAMIPSTAARGGVAIDESIAALRRCQDLLHLQAGHEEIAGEIHYVLQALGELVGTVYTEDLLDRIFGRFCIGK